MTSLVNDSGDALVVVLLEHVMHRLRAELYTLSDQAFPGLRMRHYRTLSFLPADGARLTQLTAVSGLTKQAMAQALRPLEEGGYVEVLPDPGDRRARVVRLTDRGREANDAVRVLLAQVERDWAARVGAERYAVARSVLEEMVPTSAPLVASRRPPDVHDVVPG